MTQDIEAMVCWMSDTRPLTAQSRLIVKHTTRTVKAIVRDLQYRLDVNTLHRDDTATSLSLNEIGRVTMRLTQPVFCDPYTRNRMTGGLILIDEATNATVGRGDDYRQLRPGCGPWPKLAGTPHLFSRSGGWVLMSRTFLTCMSRNVLSRAGLVR